MVQLVVLAIVIVIIAALLITLKAKRPVDDAGLLFEKREPLFTPAERSFLGVLEQVLDKRYRIFGKVRLDDLVKPAKGLSPSKRATARNKAQMKHVDFVICSADALAVVGVIELDDKSHQKQDRIERDRFLEQALASANIPLARFEVQKGYRLEEVRAKLVAAFMLVDEKPVVTAVVEETKAVKPEQLPVETAFKKEAVVTPTLAPLEKPEAKEIEPVCPKCAAQMVKRQASKGPHAGKWFWACAMFPKCRAVLAIDAN